MVPNRFHLLHLAFATRDAPSSCRLGAACWLAQVRPLTWCEAGCLAGLCRTSLARRGGSTRPGRGLVGQCEVAPGCLTDTAWTSSTSFCSCGLLATCWNRQLAMCPTSLPLPLTTMTQDCCAVVVHSPYFIRICIYLQNMACVDGLNLFATGVMLGVVHTAHARLMALGSPHRMLPCAAVRRGEGGHCCLVWWWCFPAEAKHRFYGPSKQASWMGGVANGGKGLARATPPTALAC